MRHDRLFFPYALDKNALYELCIGDFDRLCPKEYRDLSTLKQNVLSLIEDNAEWVDAEAIRNIKRKVATLNKQRIEKERPMLLFMDSITDDASSSSRHHGSGWRFVAYPVVILLFAVVAYACVFWRKYMMSDDIIGNNYTSKQIGTRARYFFEGIFSSSSTTDRNEFEPLI